MFDFKKIVSTYAFLILMGANALNADPLYDPASITLIENIKKDKISSRFPYLWVGADYSKWSGLVWDNSSPRQLVSIELPPPEMDVQQGNLFRGFVRIEGVPGLKNISILNFNNKPLAEADLDFYMLILKDLPNLSSLNLAAENDLDERIVLSSLEKFPKLKKLNLSGGGYDREQYKTLLKLSSLEELTIDNSTIDDLYYIKELKNLKHLSLKKSGYYLSIASAGAKKYLWAPRVTPLKIDYLDNMRLESLDLSRNKILKIEGLHSQANLKKLSLAHNDITKIEGLDNLEQLVELNLQSNRISTIKNLDNLINLERLDLSKNTISEIQGLDNLQNLRELNLRYNPLKEIKGLENLTSLKSLEIDRIEHISGLSAIQTLERLIITGKPGIKKNNNDAIANITGLDRNIALKYLDLKMNTIQSLEGLETLQDLAHLNLGYNELENLASLPDLCKLIHLSLEGNNLVSIEGVQKLFKLESLDLSNNRKLVEFSPIKDLPLLKKLALNNMDYVDAPNIHSNSLNDLDLSNNRLDRFPELPNLPALEGLNVSRNKIHKISESNLPTGLKRLDVSGNNLTTLTILNTAASLEWLNAAKCNLNGHFDLADSGKLLYVDLSNNNIHNIIRWKSLPSNAIINVAENSLPLSFLHALMIDSRKTGRQWRIGKNQHQVFGDVEIETNGIIDLSDEFNLGDQTTRFKVERIEGSKPSRIVIVTNDYDRFEGKKFPRDGHLITEVEKGYCQHVGGGRFKFEKPGSYKIYMYNDSVIFHQPSSTLHRENVVEASTGLISVK